MRILMLNYEFPPLGGGGGVIFYHLAEELARRHEVDVLTTGHPELPGFEVLDGIGVHRVPVLNRRRQSTATLLSLLSFPLASVPKGIMLCRKRNYDVLNTHFAIPTGPTGVILSRIFDTPNVLSTHGGDLYDPTKALSPHRNFLLRKTVQAILNRSTCVLAQSADTRRRALGRYKINKDVSIIPWGLKQPIFEEPSRAEFGLAEDDFVIIAVGRLVKRKGLDCLVQAIARTGISSVKLLIVGDGPERERLESLAGDLGVRNRIDFLGPVAESKKFQYLSASDLFVLPSLHEGFGIVFLEAMHCGLPVITTDCGGQTDFLRDGHNGYLVPVNDVQALADKISMLLRDSGLRTIIGQQNKQDVTRFSIASTAERYEEVFEQAAIGSKKTGR